MYCYNICIASDMPIARAGHLNACWSCYNHARTIYKLMITMHAWQERLETKTKESHKTKPNHQLCIILTACSNNNSSLSINTICRCISYTDIYLAQEWVRPIWDKSTFACMLLQEASEGAGEFVGWHLSSDLCLHAEAVKLSIFL